MVDNKDLLILHALKENAKASVVQISKNTGLPATTIHNRIKKLEKNGIIKGYTIRIDHKKAGKEISAIVLIVVNYNAIKSKKMTQHDLAKEIAKMPNVEEASVVTGQADIILKARARNMDELNQIVTVDLRNTDGVENTVTMVILSEVID